MSYYECEHGEHLAPLPRFDINHDDSSSSDDSEVEIVSTYDPDEHELIQLSAYLRVGSCSEDDNESEIEEKENDSSSNRLVSYSNSDDSADDSYPTDTRLSQSASVNAPFTQSAHVVSSVKLKRRQWSIREKLQAISTFEKKDNKYQTCKSHGCSPSQLRKWLVVKDQLQAIAKQKSGSLVQNGLNLKRSNGLLRTNSFLVSKRKRVNGAGKKIKYKDLDSRLLAWFHERRSPPSNTSNSPAPAVDIRREKVTFRQLQRQGERISDELHHDHPSTKWFRRFMKRHRLSLQRPKRQQKIPIDESHRLAHSFYSFIRRSSTWGPSRGPMGCFTPKDVFNMDESPLALFGDQTKRSINYVNTCNEISGHLPNKRFATVILTVSAEDTDRVGPTLLFKGKGRISPLERQQYAKGVNVIFTPKAVINKPSMDQFVHFWHEKVKDGHPKLLVVDSASSHLNPDTIRRLKEKSVVVAVVPGGTTMYLQILDVSVFSVFKQHYCDVAEEWLDANGPRSKVKLSSAQSRVLCTRLTKSAWLRTLPKVDFKSAFHDIGYTWYDNSPVYPRALNGFCFDPSTLHECLSAKITDDNNNRIEREANVAREEINKQNSSSNRTKQTNLKQFWK